MFLFLTQSFDTLNSNNVLFFSSFLGRNCSPVIIIHYFYYFHLQSSFLFLSFYFKIRVLWPRQSFIYRTMKVVAAAVDCKPCDITMVTPCHHGNSCYPILGLYCTIYIYCIYEYIYYEDINLYFMNVLPVVL